MQKKVKIQQNHSVFEFSDDKTKFAPDMQIDFTSSGFNEALNLSNDYDQKPINASMYTPNLYQDNTQDESRGISTMAAKMKSMQDMLNQKLKKVKNINWDVEDE
jgi:hypothetical protein